MQTFLPYPDFARTAATLDARRLGKQRIEAMQVMRAIGLPAYGWGNHPVVRMWRRHPVALAVYQRAICAAWTARGFADTCWGKLLADLAALPGATRAAGRLRAGREVEWESPPWLGDEAVHASHRAALLRKDPLHYGAFGWEDAGDAYVWPVPDHDGYRLVVGPPGAVTRRA
jgi:hypothetical protein